MRSILLLTATLLLLNSCVDLRTETVKKNPDSVKAKRLLVEMGKAHGIKNWAAVTTYTASFEDEFFGKLGESSKPYPETKTQFDLNYIPASFDGQLEFTSGEWKGKKWGIQAWNTYTINKTGNAVAAKNKDAYFWLPTYQYFIEFPLRIQEATALSYAGEQVIDGKLCDGVLASWGKTKPQKKIDQYLIWIERDTKLIYKLEYTVREYYSFLKGAVYYTDYKDYAGIQLPQRLPVESNLVKKGFLHEMRLINFQANTIEIDQLRPIKDLESFGDQKP